MVCAVLTVGSSQVTPALYSIAYASICFTPKAIPTRYVQQLRTPNHSDFFTLPKVLHGDNQRRFCVHVQQPFCRSLHQQHSLLSRSKPFVQNLHQSAQPAAQPTHLDWCSQQYMSVHITSSKLPKCPAAYASSPHAANNRHRLALSGHATTSQDKLYHIKCQTYTSSKRSCASMGSIFSGCFSLLTYCADKKLSIRNPTDISHGHMSHQEQ